MLKITYDELISKLRDHTYTAPDRWLRIEDELKINDQLQNLKTYTAPDDLWDKIESGLTEGPTVQLTKKKSLARWSIIAVVVCVISLIGYYQMTKSTNAEVSYSSDRVVETTKSTIPQNSDNIIEALEYIRNNDFLITAKEKIDYDKQLQKLDDATAEVKAMQEMYGIDKRSKKMLAKIEREKAELIKSMIKGV